MIEGLTQGKYKEPVSIGRIDQVLRAFDSQSLSGKVQMRLLKEMMEIDRRARSIETTFTALYTQLTTLEENILNIKKQSAEKKKNLSAST